MRIELPELCLVALVGASGSGKSTFAKKYFKPTEILSSDGLRGIVSDDENDQSATADAFDILYYIAGKRLGNRRLTVVDATNINPEDRKVLIAKAREYDCLPVAIVFEAPEAVCIERNMNRPERKISPRAIRSQCQRLSRNVRYLQKEGFRKVFKVKIEDFENVEIVRQKLWNDKRDEHGPFDIIGDVHGCYDELCMLLERLGYQVDRDSFRAMPTAGRRAVFLGDIADRGPKVAACYRLVMGMVREGTALCVPGNHDDKLLKYLRGKSVTLKNGLEDSVLQLESETDEFKQELSAFIDSLISHYVFDDGKLTVAHAGLSEGYQGRSSGRVRNLCLYGDTTGESDEYGLPVRLDWTDGYRGDSLVVFGHTPKSEVRYSNNTVNIDTGCVFGGRLTAYRYPEGETVSVDALREYCTSLRPLQSSDDERGDMLDIADVCGKKVIHTSLAGNIVVREENSAAALEVMSRFAVDPHWLVYLPPTMSPAETSAVDGYLEYPAEAFAYYRDNGVKQVVCEKKHMGSRAVIVLCRDSASAAARLGVSDGRSGIVYTRTGRAFFPDRNMEMAVVDRMRAVLVNRGFFEDFQTDFAVIDSEIMPWSAKAQSLIREQYAATGCSGLNGLLAAVQSVEEALKTAGQRGDTAAAEELQELMERENTRLDCVRKYGDAYREYCWEVNSIEDYRIAPFHILATEGQVFGDKDHIWHMETIKKYMTGSDTLFMATDYAVVNLDDERSVAKATDWWLRLTDSGGEGMVVKPLSFTAFNETKLLQPAVKCRGKEYLRIIYGPEYDQPGNLERLRQRGLGKKRSMALKEFALGLEGLKRFVDREPLYKIHECCFAVLAMESEPVDPRL